MKQAIRAIYEQGYLRLVDPVPLREGQEIEVLILSEKEQARAALADLLVEPSQSSVFDADMDEEALLQEIEAGFQGIQSLSDAIIAERREGR